MLYRQKFDTFIRDYDGLGYVTSTGLGGSMASPRLNRRQSCKRQRRTMRHGCYVDRQSADVYAVIIKAG